MLYAHTQLCSLARFDFANRGVRQPVQPPDFAVVTCSDVVMSAFYSLGALIAYIQCNATQNKENGCRRICTMCQQTSPKCWFGNMNTTSNCDVTNNVHQIQTATTCPWMKDPRENFMRTPLYTRNSSCITWLWLHHNHKMSISCHKIGLVSRHQSVGRWLIFYVFCRKNILTKMVAYHQPTCLCVKMEFVVGNIAFMWINALSWSCFRSCGSGTIVYGKWCFVLHVPCCGSCMVSIEYST